MRRLRVPKQPHIAVGGQHHVALRAVPATDVDDRALVHGQNVKAALSSDIGKFNIPLDGCLHARDENSPVVVVIVGYSLDASANDAAVPRRVRDEDGKRVRLAFQRHAFSGVSRHDRRFDFHARRLVDRAARLDGQRVEVLTRRIEVSQIVERLIARGDIAVDRHIPADGREVHVVCCR